MRPGPLPAYGQPGDPSLAALLVLTAGVAGFAAIAISPDLRRRLATLRPLPLRQRIGIQLAYWKRKWL